MTEEQCRKRWIYLRDRYVRMRRVHEKAIPSGLGGGNSFQLGSSSSQPDSASSSNEAYPDTPKRKRAATDSVTPGKKAKLEGTDWQASLTLERLGGIIEFYNSMKGDVDTFDQICSVSSCSSKTRRWPLCIFYGMLNAANVNSYIIYKENMERVGNRQIISRKKFMLQVRKALITPWATSWLLLPLPRSLQFLITTVCIVPSPGSAAASPGTSFSDSRGALVRCCECPVKSDRKTHHRCNKCVKPMCPRHLYPVCGDCI
ncbi:hypothetical protein Pcinc_002796 [Petrolisthes cinctipes]|uniref:PiggyBac transposable element-derived protein domain-containing protein n=1 Tax=Petrolisthes cinctipes TaxID=88211 RepID=A0AAE1L332_PETCI|nr:hypothetical protein Pcinc_002796 [Petrolisthes cinctipes]